MMYADSIPCEVLFYPTDPVYAEKVRRYQGCPTIAVTRGGRIYLGWYSGGRCEPHMENYNLVVTSDDGGSTWSEGEDTGWGGPDSRFFIRRLRSGRVLLINHYNYTGRSHLTAMLSEDEGKTWPHKLLLDERQSVSYPDAVEAPDGNLYITYDRERGCFLHSMEEVYACAREVLVARITEKDILAGKLVGDGSYRKRVASKLGKYADGDPFENQ